MGLTTTTAARLLFVGFVLSASSSWSEPLSGKVLGVVDGDTVAILIESRTVRVRIADIDAPETGQPFSSKSRGSLVALCRHQQATIEPTASDRYGRIVAHVTCGGVDVGAHQVGLGHAWAYTKYAHRDSSVHAIERSARAGRAGLWSDAKPIPPWEWRASRRGIGQAGASDSADAGGSLTIQSDRVRCADADGMLGADGVCIPMATVLADLLSGNDRGDLVPAEECGSRGGPGYRRSDGKCAGWKDW